MLLKNLRYIQPFPQQIQKQLLLVQARRCLSLNQSQKQGQASKQEKGGSNSNLPLDQSQTLDTIYYDPAKDQTKPQTNLKYPRLYGHNLCLFSERVRLAFAAKHIKIQKVQMDMKEKGFWHLQANRGLIPLMEMPDGTFLHESRVLMELANDLGGKKGYQLYSDDPIKAARQRTLIEQVNNYERELFAYFASRGQKDSMNKHFVQIVLELEDLIGQHHYQGQKWLFGSEQPTMADLFIFPFIERIVLFKHTPWEDAYYKLDIDAHAPLMKQYVDQFREIELFKNEVINVTAYGKYLEKYRMDPYKKPKFELEYLEQI
eukprot:403352676